MPKFHQGKFLINETEKSRYTILYFVIVYINPTLYTKCIHLNFIFWYYHYFPSPTTYNTKQSIGFGVIDKAGFE